MRRRQTPAERFVWNLVRRRQMLGLKFRRQHRIGPFVVDFYCAELRLVLELDGPVHAERRAYDLERTTWLRERGYQVCHIPNAMVSEDALRNLIVETTGYRRDTEPGSESPPSPRSGEGDRG